MAETIARHAAVTFAPPFGPIHAAVIEHAQSIGRQDVVDRQREWLGLTVRENIGLWRFLVAVLGLFNTGGGEFIFTENRRQGRQAFRAAPSGSLPAYEYRILKLKRPTTPEIVKKALPSISSLGKRWHTVRGDWAHRCLATAECAKHPKVCERAVWQKVLDPETGEQVGSQRYECTICHRHRWWLPQRNRGNKALGIVDKGYLVTASGSARPSHQTVEVVEKLPPGVRIKTTPRFDAVEQQKEG
jgi:hypothetical protein